MTTTDRSPAELYPDSFSPMGGGTYSTLAIEIYGPVPSSTDSEWRYWGELTGNQDRAFELRDWIIRKFDLDPKNVHVRRIAVKTNYTGMEVIMTSEQMSDFSNSGV